MNSRQLRTDLAKLADQQQRHPLLDLLRQYLQAERDNLLSKLATADSEKDVRQLQGRVQQLDDMVTTLWPKSAGHLTNQSNQST